MRTETAPDRSDRRLLLFVLLNILLPNADFKLIAHFVFHTLVDEIRGRYMDYPRFRQFTDSWGPMLGSTRSCLISPPVTSRWPKPVRSLPYPKFSEHYGVSRTGLRGTILL